MVRRTFVLLLAAFPALAATETYRKPPHDVLEVLNAPLPPQLHANPAGTHVLLADMQRYPSIADLAQPWIGLAGVRLNPKTNGPQVLSYAYALRLKAVSGGQPVTLPVPKSARLGTPSWSPDGSRFIVTNTTAGTDSGWKQDNELWTSSGLAVNTEYSFKATARNAEALMTPDSPAFSRYTLIDTPTGITFGAITSTRITARRMQLGLKLYF